MEAGLTLILGLALTFWGGAIMMRPSRVTSDSASYWFIMRMHFGWIDVARKAAERPLTHRQIRFHGTLAFVGGLIMLLAALAYALEL